METAKSGIARGCGRGQWLITKDMHWRTFRGMQWYWGDAYMTPSIYYPENFTPQRVNFNVCKLNLLGWQQIPGWDADADQRIQLYYKR